MQKFIFSVDKKNIKPQEAIDFWVSMDWGTKQDYEENQVEKALANSDFIVSVRTLDKKLIGLARVLSDNFIHTTIADIAVRKDFQNQGIGAKIMDLIKEKYGATGIFIDALKENQEFFKNCGYKKTDLLVYSKRFVSKNNKL